MKETPAPALLTDKAVAKPVKVLVPMVEAAPPFKVMPKPAPAVPAKVELLTRTLAWALTPVPVPSILKTAPVTIVGVLTIRPVVPVATVNVLLLTVVVELVAPAIVKTPPFR